MWRNGQTERDDVRSKVAKGDDVARRERLISGTWAFTAIRLRTAQYSVVMWFKFCAFWLPSEFRSTGILIQFFQHMLPRMRAASGIINHCFTCRCLQAQRAICYIIQI